jgi:hypothetical protein
MNKELTSPKRNEEEMLGQVKAYTRPELKKHGKLKSNATQTSTYTYISTYTYTYIT